MNILLMHSHCIILNELYLQFLLDWRSKSCVLVVIFRYLGFLDIYRFHSLSGKSGKPSNSSFSVAILLSKLSLFEKISNPNKERNIKVLYQNCLPPKYLYITQSYNRFNS